MNSASEKTRAAVPAAPRKALWLISFFCTVAAAALLCFLCLFGRGGIFAAAPGASPPPAAASPTGSPAPPPAPPPAPQTSETVKEPFDARSKVAGLEAAAGEMSKRIEQVGNHATQVLNVIGLLIGFMTAVVAIGLWQSKQYIDRVVSHSKTEMEKFIKESAEAQLRSTGDALTEQFNRTTEDAFKKLDERAGGSLREVETLRQQAGATIVAFSRREMEATLYVVRELFERFAQAFAKVLDATPEGDSLQPGERALLKGNLQNLMFTQTRLLEALVNLESSKPDEVLGACHTISALGDYTYLPTIDRVLARWREKNDQLMVRQIEVAYDKLSSVQDQGGAGHRLS